MIFTQINLGKNVFFSTLVVTLNQEKPGKSNCETSETKFRNKKSFCNVN